MKLLGISGSLRQESHNTQLLNMAMELDIVSEYQLANIQLPLFNEDRESLDLASAPVTAFMESLHWADAILIASPEYNKNLSGSLKNALDWASRMPNKPLFKKPIAICSVSAGKCGGVRGQYSLRHCLAPFKVNLVEGPELAIQFPTSENEQLNTEKNLGRLNKLIQAFHTH